MRPPEATDILSEDYICVDPEVGEQSIRRYVAEIMSDDERQAFEDHLIFCRKCQEELRSMRGLLRFVKAHKDELFAASYPEMPLPVTTVLDGNRQDVTMYYHETPLIEQFAASAGVSAEVVFPFTVKYANGRVIGEFLKRAGQLFFRLKKSDLEEAQTVYLVVYTPPSYPSDTQQFEFRVGEDKRLGAFREFVETDTMQAMLATIKQFHVLIKKYV